MAVWLVLISHKGAYTVHSAHKNKEAEIPHPSLKQ